jgi:hypothetical protein
MWFSRILHRNPPSYFYPSPNAGKLKKQATSLFVDDKRLTVNLEPEKDYLSTHNYRKTMMYSQTGAYAGLPVNSGASSPYVSSGGFSNDACFYKDKPRHKHPLELVWSQLMKQNYLVLALLGFSLFWSFHSRNQRAWLLREMQVKSVDEAVSLWNKMHSSHSEIASELDWTYGMQDTLEKRDDAWKHQVEILQNATKKESRRAVMDKYGDGPHQVELTVQVPGKPVGSFVVELASLKLMPHAAHFFLEQVSHGLWNRATFGVNRVHVLQALPRNRQLFREYDLDSMAFPEYSDQFPHKQWTLGYAGRPGGPSWYINKIDNELDHGPFGQNHHPLTEHADPCFAKVVGGFDVLQSIFDSERPSEIIKTTILNWEDHWTDISEEEWHKMHEDFDDGEEYSDDALHLDSDDEPHHDQSHHDQDPHGATVGADGNVNHGSRAPSTDMLHGHLH